MQNVDILMYEGWFRFNDDLIKYCDCYLTNIVYLHGSQDSYSFLLQSVDKTVSDIITISSSMMPTMKDIKLFNYKDDV
jgi:hypothetical protein